MIDIRRRIGGFDKPFSIIKSLSEGMLQVVVLRNSVVARLKLLSSEVVC